jgi:hypothetical protein
LVKKVLSDSARQAFKDLISSLSHKKNSEMVWGLRQQCKKSLYK